MPGHQKCAACNIIIRTAMIHCGSRVPKQWSRFAVSDEPSGAPPFKEELKCARANKARYFALAKISNADGSLAVSAASVFHPTEAVRYMLDAAILEVPSDLEHRFVTLQGRFEWWSHGLGRVHAEDLLGVSRDGFGFGFGEIVPIRLGAKVLKYSGWAVLDSAERRDEWVASGIADTEDREARKERARRRKSKRR